MVARISPLAAAGLLALIGVYISLLIGIAGDVAPETYASTGPAEWTPSLSAVTESIVNPRPIPAYELTLAHPIFFKSREPFVAPVKAAPPPAAAAAPPAPVFVDPGLVLGGVLMNGGGHKGYLSRETDPHRA